MATFFPLNADPVLVEAPLTLTALQGHVHGFIEFIELLSGDILVVNESRPSSIPINPIPSSIAGFPIRGNAVLLDPEELA